MTFLLEHLNVPVVGYSLPAEKDSLYDRAERTGAIPEVFADIRDYEALERFIDLHKPSTIIHMAAQPLVLKSYESPLETFEINVMGTVNVLDIAFKKEFVKAIIVVTTDKVYRNDNSGRAFVESDPLQGKDPYSASKVGTEAVVAAWQQIAQVSGGPKVISVRAGNVIGGGDFAVNRIIPDLVRGIISKNAVEIRNSESTRPWLHVLDPLHGYLITLDLLIEKEITTSINFGPSSTSISVNEIVKIIKKRIPHLEVFEKKKDNSTALPSEAKQLMIDATLAHNLIGWRAKWSQTKAIERTLSWWSDYLSNNQNPIDLCLSDIKEFLVDQTEL